MSLPLH